MRAWCALQMEGIWVDSMNHSLSVIRHARGMRLTMVQSYNLNGSMLCQQLIITAIS